MGQIYNGTLITQTNDYDSPTGDYTLAPIANPAQSDNVKDGKQGYDSLGNVVVGMNKGGYAGEVVSYEKMDSFLTEENVGRILKYIGEEQKGTPTPANPIAVGDTITQLYFDTTKTPDFSLLDWSNAEDVEGMPTLALINSDGLSAGQAHLRIVRADNTLIPTLQGTMYQLQNSVADGTNLYIQCAPEDVAFCEENGVTPNRWMTESNPFPFDANVVVSAVNQQNIWGEYISKDGQWTGGAKYKTNQTYIIEQKDGEIKALPLTE